MWSETLLFLQSIYLSWTSVVLITLQNSLLLMIISTRTILHKNKKNFFLNSLLVVEKRLDSHAMHSDVFYISLCRLQLPLVTKPGLTQHVVIKWLMDYWNSWLSMCISWYACLSCQQITTQRIKEKYKKPKAFRIWYMFL